MFIVFYTHFEHSTTQYDHCIQKTCDAYGASTMQSSKMELSNELWLDQKRTITINSDHNDHSHKE